MPGSASRDGHSVDAECGRGGGAAKEKIAANRGDVAIHVLEIAGDGDLLHRIGQLAVLDPQASRALGVVASDQIHAEAHRLSDVEPAAHAADDLLDRKS